MRLLPAFVASVMGLLALGCGLRPASSAGSRPTGPSAAGTPAAPSSEASPAGTQLAFRSLAAGATGRLLGGRSEQVIASEEAWLAWRLRLMPAGEAEPRDAPDFSREVVVAVDGEDGTNACHAVRITRIAREGAAVTVQVERYVPPAGRACSMMMVRPYHAVRLARAALEAESVAFSWRQVVGEPSP